MLSWRRPNWSCRKQSSKMRKKFRYVLGNSMLWLIQFWNTKSTWHQKCQRWRATFQKQQELYQILTKAPCQHSLVSLWIQATDPIDYSFLRHKLFGDVRIDKRRQDRQLLLTTSLFGDSLVSIKGRSLASSPLSSSSMSVVDRLMQEQRSRDAKKADATLVLTQVAMSLRKSPAWGPRWWSWSGPRQSWRPGRWRRGRRCSVKT